MLRLALKNLLQNKPRLLISVGGTGLALTLVLFFGAVFHGATGRLTVYIDRARADVWVSQSDVRTMHMSSSALPAGVTDQVRAVDGVEEVVPILYSEDMIEAGQDEFIAYVFGVPPGSAMGGPWEIAEGRGDLQPGEAVIDHAIAAEAGVGVGDEVVVLGQEMRIAGLTRGGSSIVSSVTFIRMDDFERARQANGVISFVLVRVAQGQPSEAVAARIREEVPDVTVQTREEFAAEERGAVQDMITDLMNIMNTAGYLTGLAVVTLTVYIATITRRREYGVLKALGVRNRQLYQIVLIQALVSVGMGFLAGLGITLLLSGLIPRVNELLVLSLSPGAVLRVAVISALLAGLAALLPARQIAGVEPVAVIRRR